MKTLLHRLVSVFLAVAGLVPAARAGMKIDVHFYNENFYFAYGFLSSDNTPNGIPPGQIMITSPGYPSDGTYLQYVSDGTNLNYINGGGSGTGDFASFMDSETNGNWTITVTNNGTNASYTFQVSAASVTTNDLFTVRITYPTNGTTNVPEQPLFEWMGPPGWEGTLNAYDNAVTNGIGTQVAYGSLDPSATNWACPVVLPDSTNSLSVNYATNVSARIVASPPMDASSHQMCAWTSGATIEDDAYVQFVVSPSSGGGAPNFKLVAHYTFDTGDIGADTSGNGNNIENASEWSGGPFPQQTGNAYVGNGAAQFSGKGSISTSANTQTFTNLIAALSGSFSVSLWMQTTTTVGNNNDDPPNGGAIIWAYDYENLTNGVVPMAITGHKVAFYTGDSAGFGDTLHSVSDVTSLSWVHVVVTRDQATGVKKIYVNGALDAADVGTTNALNGDTNYFSIGGVLSSSYTGSLDDVQIYAGTLNPGEVAYLYNNAGAVAPGQSPDGIIAHYDFDEGNVVAPDVSGNSNNLVLAGNFGGSGPTISADTKSGAGSVSFDGGSLLTAPAPLLACLAGDFTVSLWLKTTQIEGDITDAGSFLGGGAGIVAADVPGVTDDEVPVALTGGHVAFSTGNQGAFDDTLYSSATVNNGQWHHVVVVRSQASGAKSIYIDGQLDTTGQGTTDFLTAPQMLILGALTDASDSDPTDAAGNASNGYIGLVDDIQIYARAITSNEVQYLEQNPGQQIPGAAANSSLPPVSLSLTFDIQRYYDPNFAIGYVLYPGITVDTPSTITSNQVVSPTGAFSATEDNGSGSTVMGTLGDLLNECTNGQWTVYINKGDPSEQDFTFTMSIPGSISNLLAPVTITFPTNRAQNVSANPVFTWTGPTNFSAISMGIYVPGGANEGYTNLDGTATSWPAPNTLAPGTNQFSLTYSTNDVPGIATFTTPVNQFSTVISNFTTQIDLGSYALTEFVVTAAQQPVTLINVQNTNGMFQFQFVSQNGTTNTVQSRTNLSLGNWQPQQDILGDGNVKTFQIPATNALGEFFQVVTK